MAPFASRYAPEDPSLPKPWKGLIDRTGELFFWNTETNATQYDRPSRDSCVIEFDGASRGNPGRAGAGAVIRDLYDNSVLFRCREGLGFTTNNVAEYRALILGLDFALSEGFTHVRVHGDSQLVCMQVRGRWKANHPQMARLCNQARELLSQFEFFHIEQIGRESNSEADAQANQAINLAEGQRKYYA